jgi:hypothetical protein
MGSVILRNEGSIVATRRVRILRKLRMTCTGMGLETYGTLHLFAVVIARGHKLDAVVKDPVDQPVALVDSS